MLSNEINETNIGGTFTATITGTVEGITHGPDWTEVHIDVGLPGGSTVAFRFVDGDPIEVDVTAGEQKMIPAPPPPDLDPETGLPIETEATE